MILIVLLVLAAIMSVASVIVSYVVHEDEEAFVDDWNSNDPSRDAETNLVDDGNATTVPATDNSMTVVASLIQMNTNRSFAIYNNTEVVIGKGSQANIIVSNPIISRAHAKISCRNGVCTIPGPWLQKRHVRGRRENSGQQYSDAGEWYVYHARKRNLPVQNLSRESIRTG